MKKRKKRSQMWYELINKIKMTNQINEDASEGDQNNYSKVMTRLHKIEKTKQHNED